MTAVLRLLSRRGEPSRAERRGIVVFAALTIAATGAFMLFADPHGSAALVLLVLTLVVAVPPLFALEQFRRNVFGRANADERERQRRDDAYRLSYRVVQAALGVLPLLLVLSPEIERRDWVTAWFVAFGYVNFLPYMVFAWREPDAVPD